MTGQAEMVVSDHISHLLRLPNNMRGEYAVSVVNSDISPDIRREVLMAAWMHDYVEIWRAAGSSAAFNRLWRRAGFSVGHLDFPLTVWRGGRKEHWKEVAIGFSWTLDRDTACWFAMAYAARAGSAHADLEPFVIRRIIKHPRQVLAHVIERSEDEIIVANPAGPSKVDGTASDWATAASRAEARIKADRRKFAQSIKESRSGP